MPAKPKASPTRAPASVKEQVPFALSELERLSTARDRANLARFGINATKAFGASMANIQKLAKRLGQSHDLALALWETGWYEARMLSSFVDEPAKVTSAQMDRWCRDFDNWGIVDTVCFKLFDQVPHAWSKVPKWCGLGGEFPKRAGFVLIACLAAHDKDAGDDRFLKCLPLIERGASDERNFVKKGVSWALRMVGRRSARLNAAAVTLSRRLAESPDDAARWTGRGAVKELTSPAVTRKFGKRRVA